MNTTTTALVDALRQAEAAIAEAGVADDLRGIAFEKAFEFLTGASNHPSSRAAATSGALGSLPASRTGQGDDPIQRIAEKVNVDAGLVSRVYDVDDDGVHLTLARSTLHEKKRLAMQEVARLLMAGRQALELEEFTPSKLIRAACDDRGVLDASNFANALSALDGHGIRLRGAGSSREAKMNAAGFETAGEDIKRISSAA